jgi:hypothetical protein
MPRVMSNKKFLALVQEFTAVQAVGPSAVRGQCKGTLEKIHAYLGRLWLDKLAGMDCTATPAGLTRTRDSSRRSWVDGRSSGALHAKQ